MKFFYLRLSKDEFTYDGTKWISGVVDLYDNESAESELATPSYRNFSIRKSEYGLNYLEDRTWVGMDDLGDGETDTGFIENNRYIDTSGRIDLMNWHVEVLDQPGTEVIVPTLNVRHTDDPTLDYPDDWPYRENILLHDTAYITGANRYAKFELNLNTSQDQSEVDFEFYIRVGIMETIMAPFFAKTKSILDVFPEWMEMRELEERAAHATPELATPVTVGAQFLNAVSGRWLEDLDDDIDALRLQEYIKTTSLDQVAWVYASGILPDYIWHVTGDGVELAQASTFEDFEVAQSADVYYLDLAHDRLLTHTRYDDLQINYESYDQSLLHVWNWFDEFGYSLDLRRHYAEGNESYRARILDVYINRPGVGVDNFKLALRRELNLWKSFGVADEATPGATPDSYYLGATPTVLEIPDIEDSEDFMEYDGLPTEKFRALANELAEMFPVTWGYFKWGHAFWDIAGPANEGYAVLPYRYDATPLDPEDTQSGVGDGNDLYLYRPDVITGPREFEARFKVKGLEKSTRTEYRLVEGEVEVTGIAQRYVYDNPEVTHWFTCVLTTDDATPVVYRHSFQLSATSDVDVQTPTVTSNSWRKYAIFDDGELIAGSIWYDEDGNALTVNDYESDDPFNVLQSDIDTMEIRAGQWNPLTETYSNTPSSNNYTLWFSHLPDTPTLEYPATSISIDTSDVIADNVTMLSKSTSSSLEDWESTPVYSYKIYINGEVPDQTEKPFTIPAPNIYWDPNVTGTKQYRVRISTRNGGNNDPVLETTDANGNKVEIHGDHLAVNGLDAWTDGQQDIPYGVSELVFTTDGTPAVPEYPLTDMPVWSYYEATSSTTITGVVDENGPWRNGIPSPPGNTNYNLETVSLSRADFGIPETTDYVLSWMGVEIIDGDTRVILWLDSNVVETAVADVPIPTTYPAQTIVESYDGDLLTYSFASFTVRARVNPGPSPEWNPQIHSGWFYDRQSEYYLYANPNEETATENNWILSDVARQGAPIIVKTQEEVPVEYRQVSFWDDATPGYTLINTQTLDGTGTNALYLAYEDVYDVSVYNSTLGVAVAADSYSPTNEILTVEDTDRDYTYEVTYKVNRSFFADNEYVHTDYENRTQLVFDSELATPVTVVYESSKYDPATPIDMPLNTFYTIQDEGFVFLSHNEYPAASVVMRLSPTTIIADGQDYILVALQTLDAYGNPKPNQALTLASDFGTLEDTSLVTDRDGFAVTKLVADGSTSMLTGAISVTGDVTAEASFKISPVASPTYRVTAIPSNMQVPADGTSDVWVHGLVEDSSDAPKAHAIVFWRKGRYLYDVFTQIYSSDQATPSSTLTSGMTVADENGYFSIGPFVSATPNDPGYWFVAVESDAASPFSYVVPLFDDDADYFDMATPPTGTNPDWDLVGDVVTWLEHPDTKYGVEAINDLPIQLVQHRENPEFLEDYATPNMYTFYSKYDDESPYEDPAPFDLTWSPPRWYAMDKYQQYQLGLLGADREISDPDVLSDPRPDYREY